AGRAPRDLRGALRTHRELDEIHAGDRAPVVSLARARRPVRFLDVVRVRAGARWSLRRARRDAARDGGVAVCRARSRSAPGAHGVGVRGESADRAPEPGLPRFASTGIGAPGRPSPDPGQGVVRLDVEVEGGVILAILPGDGPSVWADRFGL